MVTYYNKKDLSIFYDWMISKERRAKFKLKRAEATKSGMKAVSVDDMLKHVHPNDFDDWIVWKNKQK